jgi:hypothetical protein
MGQTHGGNRVPSQNLLHSSLDVRELLAISERGQPIFANHTINFLLSLALGIREDHHGEEEACNGRDGLRSGQYILSWSQLSSIVRSGAWEVLGGLTVSAPAVYNDMADHLLVNFSSSSSSPASSSCDRKDLSLLPWASWCLTKVYGCSVTAWSSAPHFLAVCFQPVPGNQSGIFLTNAGG